MHEIAQLFFCTLFDKNYLIKGIVMLRSLVLHCSCARIYVLCMDEETYNLLGRIEIPGVIRVRLSEVENDELLSVKSERSQAEYCWTLTAFFTWYVMDTHREIDAITYLDSDLMFYSSLEPLFEEIGGASIAIIEHRCSPRLAHLEVHGRFNVGWVGFRRDMEGMSCLATWRDQCLEWCYARIEENRMGDQKYLDSWPATYKSVHIIQHAGAGVAPWNYPNYNIENDNGCITIDNVPLIFYHFHQLQMLEGGRFDRLSSVYRQDGDAPEVIYRLYEENLTKALHDVRSISPKFTSGLRSSFYIFARRMIQNNLPLVVKSSMRRFIRP